MRAESDCRNRCVAGDVQHATEVGGQILQTRNFVQEHTEMAVSLERCRTDVAGWPAIQRQQFELQVCNAGCSIRDRDARLQVLLRVELGEHSKR